MTVAMPASPGPTKSLVILEIGGCSRPVVARQPVNRARPMGLVVFEGIGGRPWTLLRGEPRRR